MILAFRPPFLGLEKRLFYAGYLRDRHLAIAFLMRYTGMKDGTDGVNQAGAAF